MFVKFKMRIRMARERFPAVITGSATISVNRSDVANESIDCGNSRKRSGREWNKKTNEIMMRTAA